MKNINLGCDRPQVALPIGTCQPALVGGSPRRDAFDCWADVVRYRRGARLLQGFVVLVAFVGGPTSARWFWLLSGLCPLSPRGAPPTGGAAVCFAFVGGRAFAVGFPSTVRFLPGGAYSAGFQVLRIEVLSC